MFKSKEDLIKEFKTTFGDYFKDLTFSDGVKDAFQSFAERKEFYKKYRYGNGLERLERDNNFLYEKVCGEIKGHYANRSAFSSIDIDTYNDWLFDFCFEESLK